MQVNENPTFYVSADWSLAGVTAGSSKTPYPQAARGFTLAKHADCGSDQVRDNRLTLLKCIGASGRTAMWLSQTHSATVIHDHEYYPGIEADAAISRDPMMMPVVLTADCVPIILADTNQRVVAAIHAGWQGLFKKIIGNTVTEMNVDPASLSAWIGPCISQQHYEIDEAFYQRFVMLDPYNSTFFTASRAGHYLADLVGITRRQLRECGLDASHIHGGTTCTYADAGYFSYRRDSAQSGRIANFIFLEQKGTV
ncbi:peptidoglycan editing factor PgeF [Suttonella sp. R2A3]|uniref:peptidoglycan editing factor PgeF n=1 Tax=Suttonella sp. R2A3 TaxID=2908648 RepID=UPI001F3A7C0E|nr:peptidoglycan editing factor PgeF [Suttonella sp. R2A3]UJF24682.1 peptidoglycan editing factor PgeF [Suttonella sp. R2A3]